ncbi:MAG: DUF4038 domain-containing protein [Blastocatellia bacterium]
MQMTRLLKQLLAILIILLSQFFVAPAGAADPVETAQLWGRWEKSFEADTDVVPDSATGLVVRLLSPSGKRRLVPAFWDGGRIWRVRFMPDEAGRWRYRTIAFPGFPGLGEKTGSFICERVKRPENPFLRHGPVRVARAGTHLSHADGTPFFWLGDTAWNGALLAAAGDWSEYLKDRQTKKFSVIQFVLTAPWRTAPTDAEGAVAFTGREKVRINPAFFRRMDERIDAVNQQGLLAAPVLLWAIRGEENPGWSLPEDQAILIGKYLVARYGAHHVVWIPAGDTTYTGENAARWQRIGRAVFGAIPHAPVVMHPQGKQWPFEAFANEKWVDLIGYQSGHGDDNATLSWLHSGPVAAEWNRQPVRPILNLEPPYEDHIAYQSKKPISAFQVRRAAYWSLMNAPVAGLTYGAHGIWSWQTVADEPLRHKGTGIARPWREAAQLPGSRQIMHMANLFTALPWWELRPAQHLVKAQPGVGDPARFISAMESRDGRWQVFYLPAGGEIQLTKRPTGPRAWWFDPENGLRSAAPIAQYDRFVVPENRERALILRWSGRRGRG